MNEIKIISSKGCTNEFQALFQNYEEYFSWQLVNVWQNINANNLHVYFNEPNVVTWDTSFKCCKNELKTEEVTKRKYCRKWKGQSSYTPVLFGNLGIKNGKRIYKRNYKSDLGKHRQVKTMESFVEEVGV